MSLRENIKESRILVFGAGRSGMAAVRLLSVMGIPCIVVDDQADKQKKEQHEELERRGIKGFFGDIPHNIYDGIDMLVLSPGIPLTHPLCHESLEKNIPVISELELGYQFTTAPIVAVTGTNGKTTTTYLIGKVLRQAGYHAKEAGNMGVALCDICQSPETKNEKSILVVEVSSFQLETIHEFKPHVAVVTNVSADHMDRYEKVEDYIEAKRRILLNLTEEDYFVANLDDEICRNFALRTKAQTQFFSCEGTEGASAWHQDGNLMAQKPDKSEVVICSQKELRLRGMHNVENVLAAVTTGIIFGIEPEMVREAVTGFSPLEHRLEFVAASNGLTFYNDSKATNIDSLEKALKAFNEDIVLICGGKSKNEDFINIKRTAQERVRYAVVIGDMAEHITTAWSPDIECVRAVSMGEAVATAAAHAHSGDIVLLSPGCPSYDWYRNFEERGADYKNAVMGYLTRSLWRD